MLYSNCKHFCNARLEVFTGDCERVEGCVHASTSGCTAINSHPHRSGTLKHLWCFPNKLPFITQLTFHNEFFLRVWHTHPYMFCTIPGLSAPITAPISDNTAHLWLAIYVLNTCLQPVEVVYKHNYPGLVKLVYWFECKLGLCSPLSQSSWDLVQKSMAITFLNGRIIESFLPEIRLASWDNLGNCYVAVEQQHCLDLEHT